MKRTNPFAHLAFHETEEVKGQISFSLSTQASRRRLNPSAFASTKCAAASRTNCNANTSQPFQPQTTDTSIDPFVAPAPAKYRDRFGAVCDECFNASQICTHRQDCALIALIIGVNPSEASWIQGFNYAHKSNLMWRLLTGKSHNIGSDFVGMVEASLPLSAQNHLPSSSRIGFGDLGTVCGTDSSQFSTKLVKDTWGPDFYARVRKHLRRCRKAELEFSIESECIRRNETEEFGTKKTKLEEEEEEGKEISKDDTLHPASVIEAGETTQHTVKSELNGHGKCAQQCARATDMDAADDNEASSSEGGRADDKLWKFAPRILAFAGKSHFMKLLGRQAMRLDAVSDPSVYDPESRPSRGRLTRELKVGFGETLLRPTNWPHELACSRVWILPSTSGRAAMTNAAREAPYKALSELFHEIAAKNKDT